MPPEKYGFRSYEGQMTFAEWLNHSTERITLICATLKQSRYRMLARGRSRFPRKSRDAGV